MSPNILLKLSPKSQWKTIYFLKIVVKIYESKSWLCPEPKEPPKPIDINLFLFFFFSNEAHFVKPKYSQTPIYKADMIRVTSRGEKQVLVLLTDWTGRAHGQKLGALPMGTLALLQAREPSALLWRRMQKWTSEFLRTRKKAGEIPANTHDTCYLLPGRASPTPSWSGIGWLAQANAVVRPSSYEWF